MNVIITHRQKEAQFGVRQDLLGRSMGSITERRPPSICDVA